MTDIAAIFHWPLSELRAMPLPDLLEWRERAIKWFNQVHGPKKP